MYVSCMYVCARMCACTRVRVYVCMYVCLDVSRVLDRQILNG